MRIPQNNALYKLRVLCCVNRAPRQWHPLARILFGSKDLVIPTYVQFSFDARTGGVRRLLRVRQLFVRPLRRPPLLGPRPRRVRLRQVHVQLRVGHARSVTVSGSAVHVGYRDTHVSRKSVVITGQDLNQDLN